MAIPQSELQSVFGLTRQQASVLMRADVQRAIEECVDPVTKKLRKSLPASVRKLVAQVAAGAGEEAASTQSYVKNKAALARVLGISRPTLYGLLKRPDRPPDGDGANKYDVTAWRVFAARFLDRAEVEGMAPSPKEAAIIARQDAATRKSLFDLKVAMREFRDRREVNEAFKKANTVVMRELRRTFEHELPAQQEGLSAREIAIMNRKALDDVFLSLPKEFVKEVEGE